MTEQHDEMNDFPLLPSVEPALRVPITDDDLSDAIRRIVGRCARELVTSGMSPSEAAATALGWVAEEVNLPVGELRRRMEPLASP